MAVHLVLSPGIDLDQVRRESELGLCPRHSMAVLADRMGAAVHVPHPDRDRPNAFDRMRARLYSAGECWALARRLAGQLGSDDTVYCQSEYVGLPLATMLGRNSRRPKLLVFCHNVTSRRGRVAIRLFRLADRADALSVCCSTQGDYLRRSLKISESRIHLVLEHTDNRFFSPGPASAEKTRPTIVAVGLEKRDYRTLAEATRDLDVSIRISGFSRYAASMARSLPDPMPANMTRQFYSFPDLVQLYRDADLVVASVFPCLYAAGVTTLMEGLACGRPVIATRSPGLSDYLEPSDGLSIVPPCDVNAMRETIVRLLEHPDDARQQGERGYHLATRQYAFDPAVDRLEELLRTL